MLADGHGSKTEGVMGRKRAVEIVKNSYLVAAQFQGNASPVTTPELAASSPGQAWFQGDGDDFSGGQQPQFIHVHYTVLLLRKIWASDSEAAHLRGVSGKFAAGALAVIGALAAAGLIRF